MYIKEQLDEIEEVISEFEKEIKNERHNIHKKVYR